MDYSFEPIEICRQCSGHTAYDSFHSDTLDCEVWICELCGLEHFAEHIMKPVLRTPKSIEKEVLR